MANPLCRRVPDWQSGTPGTSSGSLQWLNRRGKALPLYVLLHHLGRVGWVCVVTSGYFTISLLSAGGYAKFRGRSHDAIIRVYDSMDNVIDTHKHAGDGVKRRL